MNAEEREVPPVNQKQESMIDTTADVSMTSATANPADEDMEDGFVNPESPKA